MTWQNYMQTAERAYGLGNLVGAENALWEALKEAELFGASSPQMIETADSLADVMIAQGKTEDAEDLLLRLAELKTQAQGPNSKGIADTLMKLAEVYYGKGKYGQAEPFAIRATRIYESMYGKESEQSAKMNANLAFIFHAEGKFDQAEQIYKHTIEFRNTLPHADQDPEIGVLMRSYASLLEATNRSGEADKLLHSADARNH